MQTKVIPFNPTIKGSQNANDVATSLSTLIDAESVNGWKFYNFYTSETVVAGSSGCFGVGASPSQHTNIGFVVFIKE